MAYIQTWLSDEGDCRAFGCSLCYREPCGEADRAAKEMKLKCRIARPDPSLHLLYLTLFGARANLQDSLDKKI